MNTLAVFRVFLIAAVCMGCGSAGMTQEDGVMQKQSYRITKVVDVQTVGQVMHVCNIDLPLDSGRVVVVGTFRLGNQVSSIADSSAVYDKPAGMLHLYVMGWLDARQEMRYASEPYTYGQNKPHRIRENILFLDVYPPPALAGR